MRIFVALDIDENIRSKIAGFIERVRESAPEVRWVGAESLHVTLKFIGEKSNEDTERIDACLRTIGANEVEVNIRGYGFFPSARAPRVFWIGIEGSPALPALAALVEEKLAMLAIPKEEHAYHLHLTLARGAGGSGAPGWRRGDGTNRSFELLQKKLSELPAPEFGTMTAREFFLYRSQLSPNGSKYTKLASFSLRSRKAQ